MKQKTAILPLLNLALPILAAHLVGTLIPSLNTIIASRQGGKEALWLAATGLAGITFSAVMGFGWGIITSVGILTSNQLGRTKDIASTGAILKASLLTTFIISLPIMGLLKVMEPLWLLCGQTPEIAHLAQNYLDGLIWLVFVDLAKFSVFQFTIAHHHVRGPLITTLLSIPIIWIVNSYLTAQYSLYGLGVGTALIYWIAFIALWLYLYKNRLFRQCLLFTASWKTYFKLCQQQLVLGIPMGAMSSIELLFFLVIGLWMGQISTEHLAAHQIAMQGLVFTIMAAVSFSEAVTILIARAQHNPQNTSKFLWGGVFLTGICMTLTSCVYWLSPEYIINLYLAGKSHNPQLIKLSIITLALCGVFQIFDGIRIVFSGALRGLADTQYPMWVTLIAFWGVGLPLAYISAFILKWENIGLWLSMTIAVIVMIGLQYYRMRQRLRITH